MRVRSWIGLPTGHHRVPRKYRFAVLSNVEWLQPVSRAHLGTSIEGTGFTSVSPATHSFTAFASVLFQRSNLG